MALLSGCCLICLLLGAVSGVSARYVTETSGAAFKTVFALNKILTNTFVVDPDKEPDPDGGQTSDLLYGAEGEDGTIDETKINEYTLGQLSDVEFSVRNDTDQPMLVTFDFCVCLNDTFRGTSTFVITSGKNSQNSVSGTFVFDTPSDSTQVQLSKGSLAYTKKVWFITLSYYYYTANINPQSLQGDSDAVVNGFVLQPGESDSYTITCTYDGVTGSDSLYACYSSIRIHATPYTPLS